MEVPDGVGSSSEDIVTVLEPIEHSVVEMPNALGKDSGEVVTVSEAIEHSVLVRGSHDVGDSLVDGATVSDLIEHSGVRETADRQLPPGEEEAFIVGAVGSAAPWFLTGWADEVEIEFMIDTGCQVTILAASVFEHMCTSDPQMRAWLCPCGRRLVSADSSPLSVKGR